MGNAVKTGSGNEKAQNNHEHGDGDHMVHRRFVQILYGVNIKSHTMTGIDFHGGIADKEQADVFRQQGENTHKGGDPTDSEQPPEKIGPNIALHRRGSG